MTKILQGGYHQPHLTKEEMDLSGGLISKFPESFHYTYSKSVEAPKKKLSIQFPNNPLSNVWENYVYDLDPTSAFSFNLKAAENQISLFTMSLESPEIAYLFSTVITYPQ